MHVWVLGRKTTKAQSHLCHVISKASALNMTHRCHPALAELVAVRSLHREVPLPASCATHLEVRQYA